MKPGTTSNAAARTVLIALVAAASCARTDPPAAAPAGPTVSVAPVAPAAPLLEGIITSRAAVYGVTAPGAAVDSTPAMFVHGGPECNSKAQFYIAGSTRVTRVSEDGVTEPADTSALVVGAHVVVWNSGVVEGSCPRLTAASAVEIRLE